MPSDSPHPQPGCIPRACGCPSLGASLGVCALGCPPPPSQMARPQESTPEGSLFWPVDSGRADGPTVYLLRVGMLPLEIPGTRAKEGHESLLLGASPTLRESLTSLETWRRGSSVPSCRPGRGPAPDTAHTGSLSPSLWQTRGLGSNPARAGVPATAPGLLRWACPPWGMCRPLHLGPRVGARLAVGPPPSRRSGAGPPSGPGSSESCCSCSENISKPCVLSVIRHQTLNR